MGCGWRVLSGEGSGKEIPEPSVDKVVQVCPRGRTQSRQKEQIGAEALRQDKGCCRRESYPHVSMCTTGEGKELASLLVRMAKAMTEEGMATHSSILAWRIPWTGELGGLQSMQSQNWTRRKQLGMHAHNVFKLLKTGDVGTPLAVHWIRLHTSKAKGASLIPGQGTKRLPRGSVVKNLPANAGATGSMPGSEDPPMASHSSSIPGLGRFL